MSAPCVMAYSISRAGVLAPALGTSAAARAGLMGSTGSASARVFGSACMGISGSGFDGFGFAFQRGGELQRGQVVALADFAEQLERVRRGAVQRRLGDRLLPLGALLLGAIGGDPLNLGFERG